MMQDFLKNIDDSVTNTLAVDNIELLADSLSKLDLAISSFFKQCHDNLAFFTTTILNQVITPIEKSISYIDLTFEISGVEIEKRKKIERELRSYEDELFSKYKLQLQETDAYSKWLGRNEKSEQKLRDFIINATDSPQYSFDADYYPYTLDVDLLESSYQSAIDTFDNLSRKPELFLYFQNEYLQYIKELENTILGIDEYATEERVKLNGLKQELLTSFDGESYGGEEYLKLKAVQDALSNLKAHKDLVIKLKNEFSDKEYFNDGIAPEIENVENPFPDIFISNNAYLLFQAYTDGYNSSNLREYSFIYRQMQFEGLIYEEVENRDYIQWLFLKCDIRISKPKVLEACAIDSRLERYFELKPMFSPYH